MDGLDVQRFILDQRNKLSEEKSRLFEDYRSPRGIIPSGSRMSKRSERLRQERQAEYRDFLKIKEKTPKSVAEMRREMAHDREKEIASSTATNTGTTDRQAKGPSSTVSSYDSLKSQRLEEERRYRGAVVENHDLEENTRRPRKQWNDDGHLQQRVRFEESGVMNMGTSRGWEEDEQELMSWARGQGQGRDGGGKSRYVSRAKTPPEVEIPRTKVDQDTRQSAKPRSISAPVIHASSSGGGILGLGRGAEISVETKRNKQKEYAEILRAQIREREEAKERERVRQELLDVVNTEDDRLSKVKEERNLKLTHEVKKEQCQKERSPLNHSDHEERYAAYRPPLPPSRFNDYPYYGPPGGPPYNWGPQYYPYYPPRPPPRDDPNFEYYSPYPYYNPYYYQSHRTPLPPNPRGENPYFPPHHDIRREPPLRYQWENDDSYDDDYTTKTRKRQYKSEFEAVKTSKDLSHERMRRQENENSMLTGGGEGQRGGAMDKAVYRAELNRQMKEKKENELKARLKKEMEDSRNENEVYDPFGKGGCGAPVRDQHGNLVADLKQMRKLNEERLNLSTSPSHRPATDGTQPSDSPRTIFTYDKIDDEVQKQSAHMTYRDFLRQQVEEKERQKEEEKRQKMMEEQKELERLEKDRKKLEEDFKREREREKQREEEAKRKNEQLKREAEEKKREAARKAEEEQRRDAEQERQIAESKLRALAERMAQPLPQRRSYSPPIPTLRNKTIDQIGNPPPETMTLQTTIFQSEPHSVPQEQPTFQSSSPPVPAVLKKIAEEQQAVTQTESEGHMRTGRSSPSALEVRHSSSVPTPSFHSNVPNPIPPHGPMKDQLAHNLPTSTSTVHSVATTTVAATDQPTDILKQLAAMRMHLQSELAKKDAIQKPDHTGIFKAARQQKPRVPQPRIARPKDSAVLSALNQFTHLKYSNSARRDFLTKFPEPPDTESVLELQQDALIRHQEQQLAARLKERGGDSNTVSKPVRNRYDRALFDDPLASDSVNLPLDDSGDPFVDSTPSLTLQGHLTSDGHMTTSITTDGTSRAHPQAKLTGVGRRRQWDRGEGRGGTRVPSAGGQSQFSVTTFDVDSMAVRNDERARRLEAILNAGNYDHRVSQPHQTHHHDQPRQDPQAILHEFLRRTDRGTSRQSEHSLDCETDFQRISSAHS